MRAVVALLALAVIVLGISLLWQLRRARHGFESPVVVEQHAVEEAAVTPNPAPTDVAAHNLMLRKGPSFRIYVRWLRGQMVRSQRDVNPSFDDPESFFLDIKTGVLRANIGDIANFLNAGGMGKSPLTNIALSGDGDQ